MTIRIMIIIEMIIVMLGDHFHKDNGDHENNNDPDDKDDHK